MGACVRQNRLNELWRRITPTLESYGNAIDILFGMIDDADQEDAIEAICGKEELDANDY